MSIHCPSTEASTASVAAILDYAKPCVIIIRSHENCVRPWAIQDGDTWESQEEGTEEEGLHGKEPFSFYVTCHISLWCKIVIVAVAGKSVAHQGTWCFTQSDCCCYYFIKNNNKMLTWKACKYPSQFIFTSRWKLLLASGIWLSPSKGILTL